MFWNYECNLFEVVFNCIDIVYGVWGNGWENDVDLGVNGIVLGEEFSYIVNVYGDMMYLIFSVYNYFIVNY